jgi:hypothetical protein
MFFLVREFHSEKIALISASFYIFFPYTIFQFYMSGTFATNISLMWFAPVLLFTYRYIKRRQLKDITYAGACFGGLMLTHLINAYMFIFVMCGCIIHMSVAKKKPKDLFIMPAIIVIGVLLSAAYTLPLLYEKQFVNLQAFITEGSGFIFSDFFVLPNLTDKLAPDLFWPSFYKEFVFNAFFLCILTILLFFQVLKIRRVNTLRSTNDVNTFFIGVALVSIFLLFGASTFLWKTIPFFKYIQFPIRWLNIAVFAVSFLSASAVFWITETFYKRRRERNFVFAMLFLTLLICTVVDYRYIRTAHVFSSHALMPVKSVNWAEEHLPAGVDIFRIAGDKDFKEKVTITEGDGDAKVVSWKSAERVIDIIANKPSTVRIRTFNFPGWTAYIDGAQTQMNTEEGTKAMLINIPEGKHTLTLKFVDTPVRHYSKIISLVSFIVMVFLSFISKKIRF